MNVSDLIGRPVRTESGESLGHVHDVRASLSQQGVRVTGLVVGKLGVLERLGIGAPRALERLRSSDAVPWAKVVRADRRGVVVQDAVLEEHVGR